jgi:hypothetical protein
VGNAVCLSTEEDLPCFGIIVHILILDDSHTLFAMKRAVTDRYDCDFLSYEVRKTDEPTTVRLEELVHGIPLFPKIIDGSCFIKLRESRIYEFIDS